MSQLNRLLAEFVTLLDSFEICDNTQIMETAIFSSEQFAFKIRTTIFSSFTLQIRIYFNQGHCDYSYRVLDETPLCRWDNKEHFLAMGSFPHHFHTMDGKVCESPPKGDPVPDLKLVLAELKSSVKTQD